MHAKRRTTRYHAGKRTVIREVERAPKPQREPRAKRKAKERKAQAEKSKAQAKPQAAKPEAEVKPKQEAKSE